MYEIRNLNDIGFEEIAETWTSAFSDYIVDTTVTTDDVNVYFRTSRVDRKMSFGAFCDDTHCVPILLYYRKQNFSRGIKK